MPARCILLGVGAFFTNVHVRVPEGSEDTTRNLIVDALTADSRARGMASAQKERTPTARLSSYVRPAGSGSSTKTPRTSTWRRLIA
jgi:hypothetical protein